MVLHSAYSVATPGADRTRPERHAGGRPADRFWLTDKGMVYLALLRQNDPVPEDDAHVLTELRLS